MVSHKVNRKGFTLVECLIVIVIGGAFTGVAIVTLGRFLAMGKAGQEHLQRHTVLARLAEQFREDVWTASDVAEGEGKTPTLNLAAADQRIEYKIVQGNVVRTIFREKAARGQEMYNLRGGTALSFEIDSGDVRRISLLCADVKPQQVAGEASHKKPLRIAATLARDQRFAASPEAK